MKQLSGLLAIVFVVACGDGAGSQNSAPNNDEAPNNELPNNSSDAVTYQQDLKPLVDAYCTRCHSDQGVGPFPLTTFEEVSAVGELMVSAVENRTMPPFLAAPAVRPLNFDTSLSDEQIGVFRAWLDDGKREGDPERPAEPFDLPLRELSTVDLTIEMPAAYTPTNVPDEYRCFVIDWPLEETRFITGVNVRPGNLAIAHHAVPYLIDPDYVDIVDHANGADGSDGYPCFGGATPPNEDSFPTKIITGWAPGEYGQDFPTNTGVRVQPGSRIVLQMHYSILDQGAQPDQTAVDFSLAEDVPKNAGNLPWLDLTWVSDPNAMLIPAGADQVTHEHQADPTRSSLLGSFVPGLDPSEGIVLHSILPHLHKLGTAIWFEVVRSDGDRERIVQIDEWDFDWQGYYEFAEPVTMLPGDELLMHCEWNNTMNNQPLVMGERRTPADVTWGEGTYDEMCAASIYISGIAEGGGDCAEHGSTPADTGRFTLTFDATPVRGNPNLEGDLIGPVTVSVYRAEDVRLTGPVDGAEPVGTNTFEDVDLREGTAGPYPLDFDLPAGDYQFLGFMDTDDNAESTGGPDINDPVMIPAQATTLSCAEQPVVVSFPILLPDF